MIAFSKITVTKDQFEEIDSQNNPENSFRKLKEITDAQYVDYGATDALAAWFNTELTGKQSIHLDRNEEGKNLCFHKGYNILFISSSKVASFNYVEFDNAPFAIEAVLREPERFWRMANQQGEY